eukprot:TRINITY_DN5757_c0_g1_i1.p1 TRINITY_DN5757_c0_g1~~TRINITY_DN5757_c0_g1_i1.p1  ORF type:complete len:634 (-),score=133.78 TRINITY_DN5757_c0_g1_i1:54-1955(-)
MLFNSIYSKGVRGVGIGGVRVCHKGRPFVGSLLLGMRARLYSSAHTRSVENIKILFGSQTGTGMSFAQILGKVAKKKNFKTEVQDLADYKHENSFLGEPYVIFIVSCFGEGEPTSSAAPFYNWLLDPQRANEKAHFTNLKYSIFGLGNSLYGGSRYQKVAKTIDQVLSSLGAHRVGNMGFGDANTDIEEDWDAWEQNLWKILEKEKTTTVETTQEDQVLHYLNGEHTATPTTYYKSFKENVYGPGNPYHAQVLTTRILSAPGHTRPTKHIELQLDPSLTYLSGDYVGVAPRNNYNLVQALAKRAGFNLNSKFSIDVEKGSSILSKLPACFPNPVSIDEVLTNYVDLTGAPKRFFIRSLAEYAAQPSEKQNMLKISEASNEEFAKEFHYRSFLDILQEYPSIQFKDFSQLLELLPPLQPRYYSISSSPRQYPNSIHITSVLNTFPTFASTGNYQKNGICSGFLDQINENHKVPIHIIPSTFRLPEDPQIPIIMIATGTGIAPLRAFLMDRQVLGAKENMMFFGNYYRKVDFLYEEELTRWQKEGVLKLHLAFSHDQPQLVFVQHVILENQESVWDYLSRGAYVYVCGHQRVSQSVQEALALVYQNMNKGATQEDSQKFIKELSTSGRLKQDVFA